MLASLVIVLGGPVDKLGRRGLRRPLAMTLVFILFVVALIFTVIAILPRLSDQLTQLIQQFPDRVARRLEAQPA